MPDFRALCAELVDELEDWIAYGDEADCADAHAVVDRARAALVQPELQGPTMADLSPAAQQVFWEFNRAASGKPDDWHYLPAIAAALRAAADQVVPETEKPARDGHDLSVWQWMVDCWSVDRDTRAKLLAIAAELEAQ